VGGDEVATIWPRLVTSFFSCKTLFRAERTLEKFGLAIPPVIQKRRALALDRAIRGPIGVGRRGGRRDFQCSSRMQMNTEETEIFENGFSSAACGKALTRNWSGARSRR